MKLKIILSLTIFSNAKAQLSSSDLSLLSRDIVKLRNDITTGKKNITLWNKNTISNCEIIKSKIERFNSGNSNEACLKLKTEASSIVSKINTEEAALNGTKDNPKGGHKDKLSDLNYEYNNNWKLDQVKRQEEKIKRSNATDSKKQIALIENKINEVEKEVMNAQLNIKKASQEIALLEQECAEWVTEQNEQGNFETKLAISKNIRKTIQAEYKPKTKTISGLSCFDAAAVLEKDKKSFFDNLNNLETSSDGTPVGLLKKLAKHKDDLEQQKKIAGGNAQKAIDELRAKAGTFNASYPSLFADLTAKIKASEETIKNLKKEKYNKAIEISRARCSSSYNTSDYDACAICGDTLPSCVTKEPTP